MNYFTYNDIERFIRLIELYYKDRDEDALNNILTYYLDKGDPVGFDLAILRNDLEEMSLEKFLEKFQEWVLNGIENGIKEDEEEKD